MKDLYRQQGIDGFSVDSAGTKDWNQGSPADNRAIQTALERGVDISSHRARQICKDDFDRFDRILVVDRANEKELKQIAPSRMHHKIRRITENDIEDPYHKDRKAFQDTYQILEKGCVSLLFEITGKTDKQ